MTPKLSCCWIFFLETSSFFDFERFIGRRRCDSLLPASSPLTVSFGRTLRRQKGMWGSESVCQRSHVSLRVASFLLRVYVENKAACRQRKISSYSGRRREKERRRHEARRPMKEDGFILNLSRNVVQKDSYSIQLHAGWAWLADKCLRFRGS